jgi:putative Ca2+/H+ antiporter (TMEM165/GDT1 family)
MYELFYGIYSFAITGVDDFLVLVLFHIAYKNKFNAVMYGTFLGLLAVMMPAYISAMAAHNYLKIDDYINPNIIIAIVLLYLAYNLFMEYFSKDDDETEIADIKQKTVREVIILSATTYFFNGLDDYVIYTSFYLKGNSSLLFSIGIVLGLIAFGMLASYFGKKILDINMKRTKLILAIILVSISSLILIF